MKTKSKLQIIDEVVKHYSEDTGRRSVIGGGVCLYKGPEGRRCAVARCLTDAALERVEEEVAASQFDDIDYKPEYRGHSLTFWQLLQDFHDNDSHWGKNKLTKKGEEYIRLLKAKYKNQ